MTIQFVVEDGTGKIDATSYASIVQFKQYSENNGIAVTADDPVIQAALNKATSYIDNTYEFEGISTDRSQALEWPRSGCTDKSGVVSSGLIPANLISAVCYLASEGISVKLESIDTGVISESYGSVSVTYSRSSGIKKYPAVEKSLRYFIVSGNVLQRVN